jgi:hypothetical protein
MFAEELRYERRGDPPLHRAEGAIEPWPHPAAVSLPTSVSC